VWQEKHRPTDVFNQMSPDWKGKKAPNTGSSGQQLRRLRILWVLLEMARFW
jgi:hypothetical protein